MCPELLKHSGTPTIKSHSKHHRFGSNFSGVISDGPEQSYRGIEESQYR